MTPEFIAALKDFHSWNASYPGKDAYLDAVYFPWDDPPIGQLVIKTGGYMNTTRMVGVVMGNHNTDFVKPHNNCGTCTCPKELDTTLAGWWRIKMLEGAFKDQEVLDYPPSLQPFVDK